MELEREPSLVVLVNPGRTLLMVMHGANSRDRVFAQDAMAPRRVFDKPMLGIGSFTEVEMICTIRPYPSVSMEGAKAWTRVWAAWR